MGSALWLTFPVLILLEVTSWSSSGSTAEGMPCIRPGGVQGQVAVHHAKHTCSPAPRGAGGLHRASDPGAQGGLEHGSILCRERGCPSPAPYSSALGMRAMELSTARKGRAEPTDQAGPHGCGFYLSQGCLSAPRHTRVKWSPCAGGSGKAGTELVSTNAASGDL